MINLTPFLRIYAHKRLRALKQLNAPKAQEQELLKLLKIAKSTEFGKKYQFETIHSVSEYQSRVPLRSYDQFWNEFWKDRFPHFQGISWPDPIRYIPVSSGTSTGTTKWFPLSSQLIRSNTRAGLDLLVHHLNNRPRSRIFGGMNFVLGGSSDLVERAPGIYSGDLSGIVVKTLPWWARTRYFPPTKMALIKDWEQKIDKMARASLATPITMLSGVPAWMLILFEKLFTLRQSPESRAVDCYPQLEMVVHGGVNFAPYYKRFSKLLEGSHAELREVYPASEGFIALADRGYGEGLRLLLDNGIFFEFVPLEELSSANPRRHWVANIEKNTNYAVVLSSCAGLWSYIIGDTVQFIDLDPPRLLITGRTSYYLSAFGEHLICDEIEDGISTAANEIGLSVSDFAVGALFPERDGELGRHLYFVEFSGQVPDKTLLDKFGAMLDKRLCVRNEDYEAHRLNNFGLAAPEIIALPSGAFADWMRKRGKLGGQNKVPRVITNQELFGDLQEFMATRRT